MRLDRRSIVDSLERLGRAPVPPPAPDFAVRTEERLRSLRPVTLVDDEPVALRPRRPSARVAALAVAAAVIALLTVAPRDDRRDVAVITDRSSTTTSTTTTTPPTTAPAPTATSTPEPDPAMPPPGAPVVTTAPALRPLPTTTVPARPAPSTTVPLDSTIPPVTTAPAAVTRVALRCTAGTREGVPLVHCAWAGAGDTRVAAWRVYRAVGTDAKRTVGTVSQPATTSYVDRDVVAGTIYRYAVEGVDAAGRTVAKSAIVEAACCPP